MTPTPPIALRGVDAPLVPLPGGHRNAASRTEGPAARAVFEPTRRSEAGRRWLEAVFDCASPSGLAIGPRHRASPSGLAVARLRKSVNRRLCENGWTMEPLLPGRPARARRAHPARRARAPAARAHGRSPPATGLRGRARPRERTWPGRGRRPTCGPCRSRRRSHAAAPGRRSQASVAAPSTAPSTRRTRRRTSAAGPGGSGRGARRRGRVRPRPARAEPRPPTPHAPSPRRLDDRLLVAARTRPRPRPRRPAHADLAASPHPSPRRPQRMKGEDRLPYIHRILASFARSPATNGSGGFVERVWRARPDCSRTRGRDRLTDAGFCASHCGR